MPNDANNPPRHWSPIAICRQQRVWLAILAAVSLGTVRHSIAADGGWDYEPYRIHAVLAIDAPGGLATQLANDLPAYLQCRVDAALFPTWIFDVQLAGAADRADVFTNLDSGSDAKPKGLPADKDKLLLLGVRWTPTGFELAAREYDQYVERLGCALATRVPPAVGTPGTTLCTHVPGVLPARRVRS